MRYRYLDDFRRGISVFAIFSYGIAVLGTPQCPPLFARFVDLPTSRAQIFSRARNASGRFKRWTLKESSFDPSSLLQASVNAPVLPFTLSRPPSLLFEGIPAQISVRYEESIS